MEACNIYSEFFGKFFGATLNQLLNYLDINLQDNNTESVILYVGVNDVLQYNTETNMNSFFINVQEMAKKYSWLKCEENFYIWSSIYRKSQC